MPELIAPSSVTALRDRLAGPMTALVTPFQADGSLDIAALRGHVEYQLQHQVPIVVTCGTIGEFPSLSVEERQQVTECAVSAVGGRAAVLASVADNRQGTTQELARHARAVGADGLLVMTPPFFKLSEDEQLDYWRWVDAHLEMPFVVYSTPANPSGVASFALLERVATLRHFAGLKEASPDVARFHGLVRSFGGLFPIVAAVEAPLPYTLLAGASGLMTSTACFAPALMWELFRAARAGDVPRVMRSFEPVVRFRDLFQPRMNAGFHVYIPFTKAACELIGLPSGEPRAPLSGITAAERAALAGVLRENFASVSACGSAADPAPQSDR